MNDHRIAVLLGDGMADYAIDSLDGKTPLEAADTPNMDYLAGNGLLGLAKTVPDGMPPGSDTASISVFGYDPRDVYTGRAPLEALNMGIDLGPRDVAFRCNLVTIDDDGVLVDFSAHHIETEFAHAVIREFASVMGTKSFEFHPGVSYRHILVWRDYPHDDLADTTPPHDIQGQGSDLHRPRGPGAETLNRLMDESMRVIRSSPAINKALARYRGRPVSAWLWGAGRKPSMPSLRERFGLSGYTISAVDLIHGIGRAVGLSPLWVDGVTGYLDTNYRGKADALLSAMERANFVFLHVESPDESGHEGNLEHKMKAIEDFDAMVVGRVMEGMRRYDDYTLLVMPDHPTPVSLRTHTSDPVPFCIYSPRGIAVRDYRRDGISGFNEPSAGKTGLYVGEAHRLMEIMINKSF
ncbi:MAG TPA: cofactor-independent phosphoglycerate mutase [Spirochaetota bacterium]|nr:cofactor-independent phosphoglycerate mutase [Spirochaetota bacterium]